MLPRGARGPNTRSTAGSRVETGAAFRAGRTARGKAPGHETTARCRRFQSGLDRAASTESRRLASCNRPASTLQQSTPQEQASASGPD